MSPTHIQISLSHTHIQQVNILSSRRRRWQTHLQVCVVNKEMSVVSKQMANTHSNVFNTHSNVSNTRSNMCSKSVDVCSKQADGKHTFNRLQHTFKCLSPTHTHTAGEYIFIHGDVDGKHTFKYGEHMDFKKSQPPALSEPEHDHEEK